MHSRPRTTVIVVRVEAERRAGAVLEELVAAFPTDSGLLAKAVNRIASTGRRIRAAGGATRTKVRDRSRAAGRQAHDLNAKLRTPNEAAEDEALQVVRRKNAELDFAETAAAKRLLTAKRALRKACADATELKRPAAAWPAGPRGRRSARVDGRDPQDRGADARPAQERQPRFRKHIEMADRLRRPDQPSETQLRMGPHHDRHH